MAHLRLRMAAQMVDSLVKQFDGVEEEDPKPAPKAKAQPLINSYYKGLGQEPTYKTKDIPKGDPDPVDSFIADLKRQELI